MALDNDTRREIDRVWNEGIKVIRYDVRKLADSIDQVEQSIISSRRWSVGLILTSIPAYVTLGIMVWSSRR